MSDLTEANSGLMFAGISDRNKLFIDLQDCSTRTKSLNPDNIEIILLHKLFLKHTSSLLLATLEVVQKIGLTTRKSGFVSRDTTTPQKLLAKSINGGHVFQKKSDSRNLIYFYSRNNVITKDSQVL